MVGVSIKEHLPTFFNAAISDNLKGRPAGKQGLTLTFQPIEVGED